MVDVVSFCILVDFLVEMSRRALFSSNTKFVCKNLSTMDSLLQVSYINLTIIIFPSLFPNLGVNHLQYQLQ